MSTLGGLSLLIGLALLASALIGDRARGRRRCPGCWYDLAGTPGMRCPECGREARRERALYRTRRRPARFILAFAVLLAGLALVAVPAFTGGSWVRAVPTTVLVWSFPTCTRIIEDPTSAIAPTAEKLLDEIQRRAEIGPLWHWQRRALVRHSVAVYERTTAKAPQLYAYRQLYDSSAFVGEHVPRLLDIAAARNYGDADLLSLALSHSREWLPDRDAVIERLFTALDSGKLKKLSRISTINMLIHLKADGKRLLPHIVAGIEEVAPRSNRHDRIVHSQSVANLAKLPDALDQAIPRLIELAGSEDTALGAVQTLGNLGPDAAPAVPVLIASLQRPDVSGVFAMWVARTCFLIGPAAADARDVIAAAPEDPRETRRAVHDLIRRVALLRLDGDDSGALDLLAEAVLSTETDRRDAALRLLGDFEGHPGRVLPLLLRALEQAVEQDDQTVQRIVLRTFSARDDAELIVPGIATYLGATESDAMLMEALRAVERLGPAAEPLRQDLERLARDKDSSVRNLAQRILFQFRAARRDR